MIMTFGNLHYLNISNAIIGRTIALLFRS